MQEGILPAWYFPSFKRTSLLIPCDDVSHVYRTQLRKLLQWLSTDSKKKKKKSPQTQWSSYCTWDQLSEKRRVVGCEAGEEGSRPGSTTKCWITCHRQALLIPWAAVLSPACEMYIQGACWQGSGLWALVGVDDYRIGAMPCLLKRATSPKASLFQSVGKGPVPRKAIFPEEMFWRAGPLHHTVPSWCRSVGKIISSCNTGQR